MRLAYSVTVATYMGPTYFVNSVVKEPHYFDRIEVYVEEYPDHTESTVKMYRGDKLVHELIDCPLDIEYLNEE